jgi:hypothetical protein
MSSPSTLSSWALKPRSRPTARSSKRNLEPDRPAAGIEKQSTWRDDQELEPEVTPPARAIRFQATTRSGTRTLPLVSGLKSREMTTLAAAMIVETSIGIAKPGL